MIIDGDSLSKVKDKPSTTQIGLNERWMLNQYRKNNILSCELVSCYRPDCEGTASILEPLYVVLLCFYQLEDLVFK